MRVTVINLTLENTVSSLIWSVQMGLQRLVFDFEVIEAGLMGITVVLYVSLSFIIPIAGLSTVLGLVR